MKKYLLGLFAVVLAVGFSAFKTTNLSPNTIYYFQYLPSSTFTESDYETVGNWSYVGTSAGSDACPGANVKPCVIHANLSTNTTSALVSFLQSQSTAVSFVENESNIDHKKPNAE